MNYKKGLEIDTSFSLVCKTCLEKFLFWSDSLNLKAVEKKMKQAQKYSASQERKELFRESKNHFSEF